MRKTLLILICCLFSLTGFTDYRIWEDRNGNQFEAEFVRELFDKVTLRTKEGTEVRMTIDEFSDLDQKYFRVMVPPNIDINVEKKSIKKFKAFELVPRIHDTFIVKETVTIKKKSKRTFTSRMHLEIFLIAKEREESGNMILLGYSESDFIFNQGNNDQFVFKSEPVEVDQFMMDVAQQRKGEDYEGYFLRISDAQGNVIETKTNLAGKWLKNPELLPNLRELWKRGRPSKRSRHFDKDTGLKVSVPRIPHYRNSG